MNAAVQSTCPECGRPIPAAYVVSGGAAYMEKSCPEHGAFRALASEDAEAFARWMAFPSVTAPPRVTVTQGSRSYWDVDGQHILNTECPHHCGVCENHLMSACCVLINVTRRCNQHCPYCFANAGAGVDVDGNDGGNADACVNGNAGGNADACVNGNDGGNADGDVNGNAGGNADACVNGNAGGNADVDVNGNDGAGDPTLAEIGRWLDRLSELGEERKFNIQLNGGEPTVRSDLPGIIRLCKDKGFEYVQLNTNGRRLAEGAGYAKALKSAGLSTVFMQFDGTDDEAYLAMRGEPLLDIKRKAIAACGAAGLPVTLVPTVTKDVGLRQAGQIVRFMLEHVHTVKGVHFQPASFFGRNAGTKNAEGDYSERVTMFALMDEIERQTGGLIKKSSLAPIRTGHPLCCFCATYIREPDGSVTPLHRPADDGCCGGAEAMDDAAAGCEDGGGTEAGSAAGAQCCVGGAPVYAAAGQCCGEDPLEIIRRDRDFVLNKWETAGAGPCCGEDATGDGQDCCGGDETGDGQDCCGGDAPVDAAPGPRCGEDATGGEQDCCGGDETGDGQDCCGGDETGDGQDCCGGDAPVDAAPGLRCGEDEAIGTAGKGAPMSFDDALAYLRGNIFTISGMSFMDATNMDAERLRRCRVQVFTPDGRLVPFCGHYGIGDP